MSHRPSKRQPTSQYRQPGAISAPPGQDLGAGEGAILRYWPAYWPVPEADHWRDRLLSELDWQQRQIRLFGRWILQPRLVCWYGCGDYRYSGQTMAARPMPPLLCRLRQEVEALTGGRFNSVLANLYRDQHDSMGWHSDNEPELGNNPLIASLSFGAERRFELQHRSAKRQLKLILGHGSLLLMGGSLQQHWRHRLPKTASPCGPRVNLTFRDIEPIR